MELLDFVTHFFLNTAERLCSVLASFGQVKDLGLKRSTEPLQTLVNVLTILINEDKSCSCASLPLEILYLKILLVETCQYLASRQSENQFFKSSLLGVTNSASHVGNLGPTGYTC